MLGIAELQVFGVVIALGGFLPGDRPGVQTVLVGSNGVLAFVPAQERVDDALPYYMPTSLDFMFSPNISLPLKFI